MALPTPSEFRLDAFPRDRLGELLEQLPAFIVWLRGPDHVIEGANRAALKLIGYRDVIGRPVVDAVPEARSLGLIDALDRVLASGETFEAKGRRVLLPSTPGATPVERILDFVYQPLVEADGTRSGVLCHGMDVTAEARTSEALRESESHQRLVLDSLPVIVYRSEPMPPHETIYVNRAVESLGFTLEEWLARPDMWESRLHPDDRVRVRRAARESLERAEPMDARYRMIARDGSVRWFHDRGEFVPERDSMRCVWQGIMLDITALHESEERQRLSFEEAGIGKAICFLDGRIERANAALCEFLGYSRDELLQLRYQDVMHPDDHLLDAHESQRLVDGEVRRVTSERRYLRRDGEVVWGTLTVALVRDSSGTPVRRIAQVQDITERKRAERELAATEDALRESEARYRHIVANAPGTVYQYVFPVDGPGHYSFVSEGARAMFGVAPEEALRDPRALIGLIHPDDYPHFSELARVAMTEAGAFRWEGRVCLASGDVRYVQVVAQDQRRPDGTVLSDGLIVDITEQRQAQQRLRESEEQLRHTQKMEAVGRLAGGVAHDFNNLITIIRASAGFLLEDTGPNDPRRDDVREIAVAADRAAALTRQLLSFSRRQALDERLLDLNEIVANLRPMLSRLIGEHIAVSVRLHDGPASVRADLGQLEQVLVNLAINARDAMPEGGRLAIETNVVTIDEASLAEHASHGLIATAGAYARLAVCDNGVGMASEIRARIFEPFFTTKEPGKGTGLGLATVYGVVKQARGHVRVRSAPGEGTTFELYFPLADGAPQRAVAPAGTAAAIEGAETVLLVEDEAGLRALARRILERHGYTVLACEDGRAALAAAEAHAGRIDVVLTDMVMPGMNGRAMADALRPTRPDTPVVYMSGYTEDDGMVHGAVEAGASYIQKPFAPAELLRVVRDTLDAR